jgi:PAS domain S-box-containing protein
MDAVADVDLQRCINDLARLHGSSALANEQDWPTFVQALLDRLVEMLHLDFIYARLGNDVSLARIDLWRFEATSELAPQSQSVGEALRAILAMREDAPTNVRIAGNEVWLVPLHVGEMGDLAAGARRAGFPNETERVVLTVAANQMAIALQGAIANGELRRELSEHVRTENELRASEHGARLLVDGIPALVFSLSLSGEVERANQQALNYFGMTLEEIRERAGRDLVHPHDFSRATQTFTESIAAGIPCELEQRLRRSDGVYRWHQTRVFPMRNENHRIEHWYVLNTDIDERKRAEDQLRARELSVRLLVESMESIPAYAIVANEVGEIVFANRQVLQYYGRTLEEVKAWPTSVHILHPDDLDHANQVVSSSLAAGVAYQDEYRLRRFDGVYRWFEGRGTPVRDAEGHVINWYVLLIDIDDRKRAERMLAVENRMLEMVARAQPLPAVLDELCGVVDEIVDDCCCSILLVDATGQRLERGAAPNVPPTYFTADHDRSLAHDSGPCALAASSNADVIVSDVESETRWDSARWRAPTLAHGFRSCWVTPIRSRDEVLGVFAIYRGISGTSTSFQQDLIHQFAQIASIAIERTQSDDAMRRSLDDLKRAEAELRQAQGQLIEAQRLSQTGSFRWDVVADEHVWSEEMCRIFEIDPATKITLQIARDKIVPEDRAVFEAAVRLGGAGGEPDFAIRIASSRDGGVKHLHAVAHRIDGSTDRPVFFGAVQDVTERIIAEDALNRARAELTRATRIMTLGALTASIAHEVNQPLSGIVTNASTCLRMLAADPPNLDGARATAQRTLRDGSRASDVIQRLRSLFVHRQPRTEPIDLNDAAREVVSLSTSELQSARVLLRTQFDEGLPRVTGDRVQLQQVILNLVANATDAMKTVNDRPRELLIATARDGANCVRLSVRDAGTGIDAHSVEKLFDAFYTTKSNGMGVGLSISRSIIESHAGRLWAAVNDGPGATFSFSIPCESTAV